MENSGGEEERSYDLEFHKEKLNLFCRLCKHERVFQFQYHSAVPIPATQYMKQNKILYNTDISKDDENIHPQFICVVCRKRMDRYKSAMSKRRKFQSNFQPQLFTAHCLYCEICNFYKRRSPRKTPRKTPKKTPAAPDKPTSTKRKSEYALEEPPKEKMSRTVLDFNINPEPFSSTQDRSISADNFIETELARKLCCQICFYVPLKPNTTSCGHIFCQTCIEQWRKCAPTCLTCGNIIEALIGLSFAGSVLKFYM